jgi:hypothetical protein
MLSAYATPLVNSKPASSPALHSGEPAGKELFTTRFNAVRGHHAHYREYTAMAHGSMADDDEGTHDEQADVVVEPKPEADPVVVENAGTDAKVSDEAEGGEDKGADDSADPVVEDNEGAKVDQVPGEGHEVDTNA